LPPELNPDYNISNPRPTPRKCCPGRHLTPSDDLKTLHVVIYEIIYIIKTRNAGDFIMLKRADVEKQRKPFDRARTG